MVAVAEAMVEAMAVHRNLTILGGNKSRKSFAERPTVPFSKLNFLRHASDFMFGSNKHIQNTIYFPQN